MRDGLDLTQEEQYLAEAVISARRIQEFLWGEFNGQWTIEEWCRMFRKRIQKIDDIDASNPHGLVELKKRLLKNAALSIALLAILDKGSMPDDCAVPSNLSEYAAKQQGCAEKNPAQTRYEKVRKLNVQQFAELFERNLSGEGTFDKLVDQLES